MSTFPVTSSLVLGFALAPTVLGQCEQGCGRGYWRNHSERWDGQGTDDFTQTVKTFLSLNGVMGVTEAESGRPDSFTLLDAVMDGGGHLVQLNAQAAAALANADSPICYPLTAAEVAAIYRDGVGADPGPLGVESAKDALEHANRLDCPLGNGTVPPPPLTGSRTTLWRQTTDGTTIEPGVSLACTLTPDPQIVDSGGVCAPGLPTADNAFWRRFDRAAPAPGTPGIVGELEVIQVNFGVECAATLGGSTVVRIIVYNDTGDVPYANLGLLGYQDVVVLDTTQQVVNVPICPPIFVPGSATHVALAIVPQPSAATGDRFFIGANTAGESAPGALSASTCGVVAPAPYSSLPTSPVVHVIEEFVSRQPVGETTWTQSFDSSSLAQGPDVACFHPTTMEVTDTSFWRLYERTAPAAPFAGQSFPARSNCPVSGGFEISEARFGVARSMTQGGARTGRVRFYEDLDGGPVPGPRSALRLIGEQEFVLPDTPVPTVHTVQFQPTIFVPDSAPVVAVEVMIDQGGVFGIGYNHLGEAPPDSSYVSAPACGLDDPAPFAALGAQGAHMILDFGSRPMAVGTPCVVPLDDPATPAGCGSDIVFPPRTCGYFLNEPLLVPQFDPVTMAANGDVLRFDVTLRSATNIVETCGGNLGGIRSTFDAVMDLHFTVEGSGPAAGQIDRILSLPVTGAIIDSGPRPPGTTPFPTEVVSIIAEIVPADMDIDFRNLRIELGTGLGMPTSSGGEAHLIAPPCVGTVGIGEVRMSGWRSMNEGMGHSPLQGSVSDPALAPVQSVLEILAPPVPDPGGLSVCEVNAAPNSTGQFGRIRAVGSGSTAMQSLLIVADSLPAQPAYFCVSPDLGFVAQPGMSSGNLCLGGSSVGRYACTPNTPAAAGGPCVPSQVGTGPSLSIDIWQWGVPDPQTPGNLAQLPNPGETFYWQCWHRDEPEPTGSNFTNVVGVTFY